MAEKVTKNEIPKTYIADHVYPPDLNGVCSHFLILVCVSGVDMKSGHITSLTNDGARSA